MARPNGRAACIAALLALAGGCATVPAPEPDAVSVEWEVALTDPCGKLAGFLAMGELFGIRSPPGERDFTVEIGAEMERRCPGGTEPDALDLAVIIPESACAELHGLLELVGIFDVTVLLPSDRRRMADDLMADLEAEIESRCPPRPGTLPRRGGRCPKASQSHEKSGVMVF